MFRHVLPITGLLLSTLLLLVGSGLTGVLLPLRAGAEGWGPVTIGWMGFFYAAMFMAGCIIVPKLVARVGHVRVYAVLATLLSMSMLLHALFVDAIAWTLLRGIAGFSLAGSYMVVESWLNEQTPNEARGNVFSFYMMTNLVGLMGGQALLVTGDPQTTVLFIVAALFYAAAVIPTGLSNAVSPRPLTQANLDLKAIYRNSPVAFAGVLSTGFTFGAWNFQAPVYGDILGLSDGEIATMMIIAMIGGMSAQFPLGRMSDRMDRRYVMIGASLVGIALSVLLMLWREPSSNALFVMMFFFGSVLMPLYSIVVAHANDHASPGDFVKLSSGLLIIYGTGNMIGPLVSGFLIEGLGPAGLFVAMTGAYVLFTLYTAWRIARRSAVPEAERTDFLPTPVARSQTPEVFTLDPRAEDN